MGGCLFNNYISPLQLGKINRGLALKSIRKYVKEMISEADYPFIVNASETWDFDIQMYQDIVVKTGATLTIKCKVGMANNGRIIVERGAQLIVDGGEVYPWGTTWEGVQVWGTSNQRQIINPTGLSTYHGIVKVINQGVLRDAKDAIQTTKSDAFGNIDWGGYFGGIVQCDNAKFINNWKAIGFLAFHNKLGTYTLPNISYIRNSLFETNALLKDPGQQYPDAFISLWAVEGVKLFGNTYQNTMLPLPAIFDRGHGIDSYDGSFYSDRFKVCSVLGPFGTGCASYSINNPSTFTNLNYGVHSTEMSPFSNITINDNDFVNCNRAILISGTHQSRITNNRIDIAVGGNVPDNQPCGIYSEYSSGYDMSNNTITTSMPSTNNNRATGIFFNGSGGLTNMLYRNTINKVNVGTTVIGDNRGTNPGEGLQIRCNQYGQTAQNYLDIWLTDAVYPWGTFGYIDGYQGNSTVGANNRFSHNSGSLLNEGDINDRGNPFVTTNYYYNLEMSQKTTPFYYSTPQIAPYPNGPFDPTLMCPASLNGGPIKSLAQVFKLIAANTNSIAILNSKIDGGNTQALLSTIASAMSPGNLKNVLEQNSPLLSDAVLIAYFSKATTPSGHIKDIHDKNKPVGLAVWQVIVNRNLPNGIMKDLTEQQAVKVPSAITNLYAQIATLNIEKGIVVDEKVRAMLSDTMGYSQDSVASLLIADNRIRSKNRLLSAYVSNNQLAKAINLLVDIKADNGGTLDAFSKFQELLVTLKQTAQSLFSIKTDAQTKNLIEQIAADKSNAAYAHAQALLNMVFGYKYYEYVKLPSLGAGLRLKQNKETDGFVTVSNNMIMYPNPTTDNVIVTCLLPENYNVAEIMVLDVMGKQVMKQPINKDTKESILQSQNLDSGLYFITLMIDGNLIETQKLIKQ